MENINKSIVEFNKNFYDRKDPLDSKGENWAPFSFYHLYQIPEEKKDDIFQFLSLE